MAPMKAFLLLAPPNCRFTQSFCKRVRSSVGKIESFGQKPSGDRGEICVVFAGFAVATHRRSRQHSAP